MIYIHRDWSQVPDEVKASLKKAADELDAIADLDERKAYIEGNAKAWAAVRDYLSGMSNAKCWYSEARESVSRYQVDHFRPHGRSKQAVKTFDAGYSWLAFDLENYRLAGMLCNTVNKEYSEDSVGKGDWFPLTDPGARATLQTRNIRGETPILLDPTEPEDPRKLWFNEDGNVVPDPDLEDEMKKDVENAIDCLGLRQSMLNDQRKRKMRTAIRAIHRYKVVTKTPRGTRTDNDLKNMTEAEAELLAMSAPSGEFAAAVRCCLIAHGLRNLVIQDELKLRAMDPAEV